MIKNSKSKIIFGAAGILSVLTIASICVTSIFKKSDVESFSYRALADADNLMTETKTQIDHIIEEADPYNVLIITSDGTLPAEASTSSTEENSASTEASNASTEESSASTEASSTSTEASSTSTEANTATSKLNKISEFFTRSNDGFTKYVINDNRTIEAIMKDDNVNVTIKSAASYRAYANKSAVAETLSDVDLIFLYGTSDKSFTGDNAISEDLYECLHNYISAGKPMIVSYANITIPATEDLVEEQTTGFDSEVWKLTTKTFKNSWKRTNTVNVSDWTINTASGNGDGQVQTVLKDFMSSGRSVYKWYTLTPNNIPVGYDSWANYWKRTTGEEAQLNILYVYGGDNTKSPATSLEAEKTDIEKVAEWMIGEGCSAVFSASLTEDLPTAVSVNAVRADQLAVYDASNPKNSLYFDAAQTIKQYDYIFIAPDVYCTDYDMSSQVVEELQKISAMTDSRTSIIFGTLVGKSVTTKSVPGTPATNVTIDYTTNYGKLVDLVVTTTGYAKKSNVLPVDVDYMYKLASAPEDHPTKVAQVVAIINKSTYKTYAGSGSGSGSGSISSNTFRVLELQPCYPIDLKLAVEINSDKKTSMLSKFTYVNSYVKDGTYTTPLTNKYSLQDGVEISYSNLYALLLEGKYNFTTPLGNYYTIPANVINSSEIDMYKTIDDDGVYKMSQEYYDWDLSKAKVAYALGLNVDQIELVQMSTDEFITSKTDVADAYDLIYVGGNMSAFKNSNAYGVDTSDNTLYPVRQAHLAYFSMYTHTGEPMVLRGGRIWNEGAGSFMNGNDITYNRLLQLEKYIDADMSIVFSNEVWTAYLDAKENKYYNRYIDPDSNVYKLCEYAEEKKAKDDDNTSILLNWETKDRGKDNPKSMFYKDYYEDATEMVISNDSGVYGTSANVSVYASKELNDALYNCVYGKNTNIRPKFTMNTTAITYVEGDKNTELSDHKVEWNITLSKVLDGHTYQAILLQDTNDNGVFNENDGYELLRTVSFDGDKATITYTYPEKEFGAFFWKVIVRDVTKKGDVTTKASASTSSITVFANKNDKMTASILEIMPMTQENCSETPDAPDGHTFYLDKNYQQCSGNPFLFSSYGTADWNKYGYDPVIHNAQMEDSRGADANAVGVPEYIFNSNTICKARADGLYQGDSHNQMGKYKTTLSINRYDTAAGHEDRDYNYMDLVSEKYDFEFDIMYMDDIEFYAGIAHNPDITDEMRKNYLKEANEAYAVYQAYKTAGTTQYKALQKVEEPLREALTNIYKGVEFTTPTGYKIDKNGVITYVGTETISGDEVEIYGAEDDDPGKSLFDMHTMYSYGIDKILQSRDYFRFFYINSGMYNPPENGRVIYDAYYKAYIEEHDKMVEAYRKYRHFSMMAYGPEEYLRRNYDVIVVGFLDDYAGNFQDFSQNAANDLVKFSQVETLKEISSVDSEGNITYGDENLLAGGLLMTHDNMTAQRGDSHAVTLTSTLRSYMGMDGFLKLKADSSTLSSNYPKYTSVDMNRYFLTNIATGSSYAVTDYNQTFAKGIYDADTYEDIVEPLLMEILNLTSDQVTIPTFLKPTVQRYGSSNPYSPGWGDNWGDNYVWPVLKEAFDLPEYATFYNSMSVTLPSGDEEWIYEKIKVMYSSQNLPIPALGESWQSSNDWFNNNYLFQCIAADPSDYGYSQRGLGVTIPEGDRSSLITMQDIVTYIANVQKTKAASFYTTIESGLGIIVPEDVKPNLNTLGEYEDYLIKQYIFNAIEDRFGVTISAEERDKMTNVSDLAVYCSGLSKSTSFDFSKTSDLTGAAWNSAVSNWFGLASRSKDVSYSPSGYTDIYNIYRTGGFGQTIRYLYGELEMEEAVKYNIAVGGPLNVTGTTKATQVNRGVVTTYPFYIASDLRISSTHGQAYALDLENEDVAVWYTLAADNQSEAGKSGGTNYSLMKQNSSLFAASPKDGTDSYYIYSVGNIVYCGAGHALITGYQRDNNDERRLFLNVLINMAKKSTVVPTIPEDNEDDGDRSIVLYDPNTLDDSNNPVPAPTKNIQKASDDTYFIPLSADIAASELPYPEFGFKVTKNDTDTVKSVQVFYDLDYDKSQHNGYITVRNVIAEALGITDASTLTAETVISDAQYAAVSNAIANKLEVVIPESDKAGLTTIQSFVDYLKDHKLKNTDHIGITIPTDTVTDLNAGKVAIIDKNCEGLKAENSYFTYNDRGEQYTYIVVRVVVETSTGKEEVLVQRIKVKLSRGLLDLT